MSLRKIGEKPSFGWRDALLGGLVTLVVTVIAGVAVWLVTREPVLSERLIYRVSSPATFLSRGNSLSFSYLNVRNDGRAKASSVVIEGDISGGSRIVAKNASFSSGRSTQYKDNSSPSKLSITVPTFYPGDSLSISFVTQGPAGQKIHYAVRSNERLATQESVSEKGSQRGGVGYPTMFAILLFVVVAQWGVIQYIGFRKYKRYREQFRFEPIVMSMYTPNRNNVGFLLMHNLFFDEAEKIFERDIEEGDAVLMTFAHLAVVRALKGDGKTSEGLLSAASWPSLDDHTEGVIALDKFIYCLTVGDSPKALEYLQIALDKTMGIENYFKFSPLLKSVVEKAGLKNEVETALKKLTEIGGSVVES